MTAQVAVVGAGVMGLAAAHSLARQGVSVELHEQFEIGHDRGSSHGRSRIFRLAYAEPEWVRLAQEAIDGWRALERESGDRLLERNGLVEIVSDVGHSSAAALDACGAEWEPLPAADAERRFALQLAGDEHAIFQPEAGIIRADIAQRALLAGVIARGVEITQNHRIELLDELLSPVVIVTAGGWAGRLLARHGIPLDARVTRETVAYYRFGRTPPSVAELGPGSHRHLVYALADPVHGLKVGCHMAGGETDPDATAEPDAALVEHTSDWVARRFRDADPEPVGAETCIYTTTPDERFVLERHGRIVVGSACSGHGFKFAPAIGDRLAGLALEALAGA